jgi:hypothetical protein
MLPSESTDPDPSTVTDRSLLDTENAATGSTFGADEGVWVAVKSSNDIVVVEPDEELYQWSPRAVVVDILEEVPSDDVTCHEAGSAWADGHAFTVSVTGDTPVTEPLTV